MRTSSSRSVLRAATTGLLAAVAFGAWAAYANRGHDVATTARAAFAQALLSFASSAAAVGLLERLFAAASSPVVGFAVAVTGTMGVIGVVLVGVHAAVGTPELLATIAPSLLSGLGFSTLYAAGLLRAARARS